MIKTGIFLIILNTLMAIFCYKHSYFIAGMVNSFSVGYSFSCLIDNILRKYLK